MLLPAQDREELKNPQIVLVGPEKVADHAQYVKEMLKNAEHYYLEFMPLEHIIELAKNGRFQIWFAVSDSKPFLCLITELIGYPNRRTLNLVQFGGTQLNNFAKHLDIVEQWAIRMGCTHVETQCRDGLIPLLTNQGYNKRATVVTKALNEERKH
jgi:hypothetical protein